MGIFKNSASSGGGIPVWLRIAIPTVASLLLFTFVLFVVHMPAVKEAMVSQKKASLKHMTQVAISLLEHIRTQEREGLLTAEEARKKGSDLLHSLHFGPEDKDYFWITNVDMQMVMHPYRPDLEGKDLTDFVDLRGNHLFQDMKNATEKTGENYITYYWQWKDKLGTEAPKLSYVKRFEPWGWIVGTGLYLKDVEEEAEARNRELVLLTLAVLAVISLLSVYSINQSRRAGEQIQDSEALFRGVFDNSFQLMCVLSSDGILQRVNQTALDLAEIEAEDVLGEYCWETPWWSYSSDVQLNLKTLIQKASLGEVCKDVVIHYDSEGNQFFIDFSITPVSDSVGEVRFMILEGHDVTALKEVQEQLAISEAMFKGVFDQSLHFMGVLSVDGTLLEVNNAALLIRNVSVSDVLGKPFWEGPWWQEPKALIPMLKDGVRRAADGQTIRRQIATHSEEGEARYIDFSLKPAFGANGEMLFLIAEGRDITELKMVQDQLKDLNAELEQKVEDRTKELRESVERLESAQTQLIQSEKMAALGDLVAGVAHEINTPIGISVTSISYMEEKLNALVEKVKNGELRKSDLDKFVSIAQEATKSSMLNLHRAAELIGNFKQVAVDQTSGQKRKINLHEYLDEILLSLRSKYKRTQHKINVTCPDDLVLNTWPGAFMQIFSNLIINSLLHGFEGVEAGSISIRAEVTEDSLVLQYSDDGNGMPEESVSKIFEPFFTTRRGKGGTGLGMSIVYNLVTSRLGGSISCTSAAGQGTAFIISLPLDIVEV
ncbi:cache domain-containing protein [Maridesulfovibrio ferrireducens]|uniref:cache domain-containing protein n=1 Tax=Maridesulfovibrio ferrireducens TaxID=246191 RepID=UPI001A323FEB|nr:cache domain-containing protein [Maridesulfovibrio ferrireducens]MBI9111721.1 cache domain-containing protein [Maridesulfovibrio ferrireducens]